MHRILLIAAAATFLACPTARAAPLPTRIYVRSEPSDARVIIDGKEAGTTDGLFEVAPGPHTVHVERDGFRPATRTVHAKTEQIERLTVSLERAAPDEAAAASMARFLGQTELPPGLLESMRTVLRQHPDQARWSGRDDSTLFGLAAKRLPEGEAGRRSVPALLELTHMLAVQELLRGKSLLDQYAENDLTDSTTLGRAVVEAAGSLRVTGSVEGIRHGAAVEDDFAAAYVVADAGKLKSHLLAPAELEKVRTAYRDVMHRQARDLMARGNWKDAILLWPHLHARELVSQALYLDAARCFAELGQADDAVRVLTEALRTFGETGTPEFFEKAGDVALQFEQKGAQQLAEQAYRAASQKLLNTISSGPENAGEQTETPNKDHP